MMTIAAPAAIEPKARIEPMALAIIDDVREMPRYNVPQTQGQLANLRRGGVKVDAATAARARAGKAAKARERLELEALAGDSPFAAYEDLHATMARQIKRLLDQEERDGGRLSRDLTDRLREFRQTTVALTEYRRERGTLESAQEFFLELERRIAANTRLLDDPVPALDIAPR
jgi:hypothetical protein